MKFEPDNEIGHQLKRNLIQKIVTDFQKGQDDALDIADYIIYLIVAKNPMRILLMKFKILLILPSLLISLILFIMK